MALKQLIEKSTKGLLTTLVCLYAIIYSVNSEAGSSQVFGDYTIHYNAFNSNVLQPKMAEAYGIVRSKNRGMLTISVIKKEKGSPTGKAVHAAVTASASNLTGQFRSFNVREIDDGDSIYYMSEFHVANEEMLDFVLQVLPEGETKVLTVRFRQQFFTQ
jgi:hypothetical protein